MNESPMSNRFITGFLAGLFLPVIVYFIVYLFVGDGLSLGEHIERIIRSKVLTHYISLCVLSNLVIFLAFNRFDKLRSSKGVVGVTLLWALTVLVLKLF
ncbi:MAG: hypothetical protein RQ743_01645 [Bacteroidales bacterium]|nr:hypothetical protein [Bacteroidales bacterium]